MNNLDFNKPVKFKKPQPGEEKLIYKVINFNEVSRRCIIQVQNLENWDKSFLPSEIVDIEDLMNIDYRHDNNRHSY